MGSNSEQQFCLKWNNHRSTILSVFDTLLEEESLVDVTLSADGQFLRAHRVILSACSPYFRTLFRSTFLQDKAPVIVLKDVDFDNLKALVEYMYKGEANVPQHMLPSFIQTAESLQIRGLAEGANNNNNNNSKKFNDSGTAATPPAAASNAPNSAHESPSPFPLFPPAGHSTPNPAHGHAFPRMNGRGNKNNMSGGGILAARLAAAAEGAGLPPPPFMDFGEGPLRHPAMLPPTPHSHHQQQHPPSKKSRKSERPSHKSASSSLLDSHKLKMSMLASPPSSSSSGHHHRGGSSSSSKGLPKVLAANNNFEANNPSAAADDSDGALKIDEDVDSGKENRKGDLKMDDDDDIVDLGNGMESEEDEEPSMPGPMLVPGSETGAAADGTTLPRRMINPWTGEEMDLPEDHDDGNPRLDTGGGGRGRRQSAIASAANWAAQSAARTAALVAQGRWPLSPFDHPGSPAPYQPRRSESEEALPRTLPNLTPGTTNPVSTTSSHTMTQQTTSPSPRKSKTSKVTAEAVAIATANAANAAANGNRLKRLTNTDNVFTMQKTANGRDRFRCKACNRCFNLKCTLLRHVRHQHQMRFVPHPCPECGQVFKRTDHLKVHLKKIHQIDSRPKNKKSRISDEGPGDDTIVVDVGEIGEVADQDDTNSGTDNGPLSPMSNAEDMEAKEEKIEVQ